MKLAPFYERIGPFLEGKVGLDETKHALFGAQTPRDAHRLAIYQRFCREHRNTATGGVHLLTRELITAERGEAFWRQLVEDYFARHPMHHAEINENGAHLSAFLASRPEWPTLWSALADFEWWEWQTFIAKDDAGVRRLRSAEVRSAVPPIFTLVFSAPVPMSSPLCRRMAPPTRSFFSPLTTWEMLPFLSLIHISEPTRPY